MSAVFFSTIAITALPHTALAADPPSTKAIEHRIETILSHPDFSTTRTEHQYEYRGEPIDLFGDWQDEDEDSEPTDFSFLALLATVLARFVEVALWAILILAVAFAIVYRKRWMTWRIEPAQARRRRAPAVVVGVDIRPESLPADIPATAWTCWRNGDPRGCLSLLYRGALATLVHARGVELPASATEADCVRRVRASAPPEVATFFDRLTGSWQAIAYARRAPTEALARSLCDDWHRHMETAS